MKIADTVLDLIGHTPMVRLNRITGAAEILVKLEYFNPCASIKDRIALAMIEAAEQSGELQPGGTVIESTSGNTGIGLAMVCAVKGYRLILTMPDNMSMERRRILSVLGAELVLTHGTEGMTGAIKKAEQLAAETVKSYQPRQFKNPVNPEIHRKTTAEEIWEDAGGKIDMLVVGVGTGGTLTGVAEVLKQRHPALKTVAVEPAASPVLSDGKPGPHKIQGIGGGFIPEILNRNIIDEVLTVTDREAEIMAGRLAREEGILAGISSGANVQAALLLAQRPENKALRIVTFAPDTGERYLMRS